MSHNKNTIIEYLPRDIIRLICKELDVLSIISLRLTCKGFKYALLPYIEGGYNMCLEEIAIKSDNILSTYFLDRLKRISIKFSNKNIYDVYISQILRLGEITGHARLYYMVARKQAIKGYSKSECRGAILEIYDPYCCPYVDDITLREINEVQSMPPDEPWTPPESDNESDDESDNEPDASP